MNNKIKVLCGIIMLSLISCNSNQINSNSYSNESSESTISYESNTSSETIIKTQLEVPTYSVSSTGILTIEKQENVLYFGLIINGQDEILITCNDVIQLNERDIIKIRAIPEDKEKYTESDYTKSYQYMIKRLPQPVISVSKFHELIIENNSNTVDEIYLEINGVVHETKISEFESFSFEEGDEIRIKYKSNDNSKNKDSLWSNYVTLSQKAIGQSLQKLNIYYNNGLHINYNFVANINIKVEINGIVKTYSPNQYNNLVFNQGDKVRVKLTHVNQEYKDGEWSNLVTCINPYEINLFNDINEINNLNYNNQNQAILTVTSSDGNNYDFLVDGNIKASTDGNIVLSAKSSITSLTDIHSISYFDIEANPNDLHGELYIGVDPSSKEKLENAKEISWISGYPDIYKTIAFSSPSNHFQIINSYDEDIVLNKFKIYHYQDPLKITNISFNEELFRPYIDGEPYELDRETNMYDYYLLIDLIDEITGKKDTLYSTPNYSISNIKDKDGNICNKENRIVKYGDQVEVIVGDYKQYLDITIDTLKEVNTQYGSQKFSYIKSKGTVNNIVIPIAWADQLDRACQENLNTIYKSLGNVIDEYGNVKTYYDETDKSYSLSEYFKISSFDNLTINSFVTNWYYHPYDSNSANESGWNNLEEQIINWFKENYSHLDMSMFDQDQNGLFDEIILINTFDMQNKEYLSRTGMTGPYRFRYSYLNDRKGTLDNPGYNSYINISLGSLFENSLITNDFDNNTLIHEYGHSLGLVDYYDTNGSKSPLGKYDMQDNNLGDWNVYSKFSVGWIKPIIISEQSFNNNSSIDVKIETSSLTDNAILIPALGYEYNGTPFDEYIMLDLFSPKGLHKYDSESNNLTNTGVRIYHVNSVYEKRTLENKDGTFVDIGTIKYTNSTDYYSTKYGKHLIEIIQSGGTNNFTSSDNRRNFNNEDLFYEGKTFDVSEYDEFFYQGLMDNGMEFGYIITIKEINNDAEIPYAIITISKK